MFTVISGVLLYAFGLIILDQSLDPSIQSSAFYDLSVFNIGCLLSILGVYFSAIHGITRRKGE